MVCDRFADSTMAYQGYGQGADRALIRALTALLPMLPGMTLVLTVPAGIAAARLLLRPALPDRYEREDPGFHARVAQGFADIAAAEPARCRVVDASGTVEAVHRAILSLVLPALPRAA